MGLTEELKQCILGECSSLGRTSLVSVMARLDYQQHAIFSLAEITSAIQELDDIAVVKSRKGMELVRNSESSARELSEQDIQNTYRLYMAMLKK